MRDHIHVEVVVNQSTENSFELLNWENLKPFYPLRKQFMYQVGTVHVKDRSQVCPVDVLFQVSLNYFHHSVKNFNSLFVSSQQFFKDSPALITTAHERKSLVDYVGFSVLCSVVLTFLLCRRFSWLQVFLRSLNQKFLIIILLRLLFFFRFDTYWSLSFVTLKGSPIFYLQARYDLEWWKVKHLIIPLVTPWSINSLHHLIIKSEIVHWTVLFLILILFIKILFCLKISTQSLTIFLCGRIDSRYARNKMKRAKIEWE